VGPGTPIDPKVLEAAVIGVKDERSGERVKAFVVLKDGQTATVSAPASSTQSR
jgi:fatty-acyl-CoA synthase